MTRDWSTKEEIAYGERYQKRQIHNEAVKACAKLATEYIAAYNDTSGIPQLILSLVKYDPI